MRPIILLLAILVLAGIQTVAAQSPTQLTVAIGKNKRDNPSKLTVKFISVAEDSRCPEGANCIWAGNARLSLKVRKSKGAWKAIELNTGIAPDSIIFEGYELKLTALTPARQSDSVIDRRRYVATFSIRRI